MKPLFIAEWGNSIVIEPMAHWQKPLHLQYKLGCVQISGKHHKQHTVSDAFSINQQNKLQLSWVALSSLC